MSLPQLLSLRSCAAIAVLGVALASLAAPARAYTDTFDDARAVAQATSYVAGASLEATSFAPRIAIAARIGIDPRFVFESPVDSVASNAAQSVGDEALLAGAAAIDDGALAHQRGTGPGLMTVGAPMLALHGAPSVTLWDEIAPPAPVPVPADSAHVAQSNTVSYFRQ
jgi:hypothetical protein